MDDDDFPGMGGGMPGRRGPPKEVENSKLYEILGVPKTATMDEIKKAYRKMAIKCHPDKGGDPEKVSVFFNQLIILQFKEIQGAYEILFDKDKRDIYDTRGMEGLKGGPRGAGGMDDIFSMFMGGRGGPGGGGAARKARVKP